MKVMEFKKCFFRGSSDGKISLPKEPFPHVVLAGRSNVGKSSFINHFFQNRDLARVSSKPGKTGLLNFFNVDDQLFFVDIPGYGYAKRSKAMKDEWKEMMDRYFDAHLEKITFLHFLDARHSPSESDWNFIGWMKENGKNVLFIVTKVDKVGKKERKAVFEDLERALSPYGDLVFYNIEDKTVRGQVKEKLAKNLSQQKVLNDGQS